MNSTSGKQQAIQRGSTGLLLFAILFIGCLLQAVKAAPANVTDNSEKCSLEAIRIALSQASRDARRTSKLEAGDNISYVATTLLDDCTAEFVKKNEVTSDVKMAVDSWLEMDLSKAGENQLLLAYQLALTKPKPENPRAKFASECKQMNEKYESFREKTSELSNHIELNLESLLSADVSKTSAEERQFLVFAQYAQFCNAILGDS